MAICFGTVAVGCRHAAKPAVDEGQSSFRFVTPPAPPASKKEPALTTERPRITVVPAEPIEPLAAPVYPKLPAGVRPALATIGVRVTIDTEGRVSDISPSLLSFSTPGPATAALREAVEAAIAQWRFTPAEIHQLEPMRGPDRSEYLLMKSSEKTEWNFDVAFTFTSTGEVLAERPKGR
ncbi:MAG TPA: hypothetical protein VM029_00965 [Opitutaceae bacterium]|nr:hypothetical protein [Opitutaceae bacterium]